MSFHCQALSCLLIGAMIACSAQANIRDYYEEPGLNPFKETINENFGEHIDPFSGQLQLSYTDLVIPGNGGFDIRINRVYNNPQDDFLPYSPYGYGWYMHFGRISVPDAHENKICTQNLWSVSVIDNPSLELSDGSRQLLVLADQHSPELITKQWWSATCDGSSSSDIIVKSPDGTTYTMNYRDYDTEGTKIYATRIEDANGNWMTIDYNTNSHGVTYIESLNTSDGRTVTYDYANLGGDDTRLTSITANGETWTYEHTYTANTIPEFAQLTKVTRPDGLSWEYTYYPNLSNGDAGSFAVDTVTYPSGGTIEYDYDYVRFNYGVQKRTTVVTEKTNSGRDIEEGTWSYAYVPAYDGQYGYDETHMVAPDHQRSFYHVGYTTDLNIWEIGTKRHELVYDLQGNQLEQYDYSYSSMLLSNENFWHGRDTTRIDTTTQLPLLTRVNHWRQGRAAETQYSNFDAYGKPQTIVETTSNSGLADRSRSLTYSHSGSDWILGLVTQEVIDYPNSAPVTQWITNNTYDAAGNLLTNDQSGVLTTYTYTDEGDVETVTDANANVTTFSDYHRGAPQIINRPEGVTESQEVNDDGTLYSSTDGRGYTTLYTWDGLNRLTGIDYPINSNVAISYDDESAVLTRGAYKETRLFDGFWRPLGIKREDTNTALSIEVTKERDEVGNVTFESYPNSAQGKNMAYDALQRLTSITFPDQASRTFSYPSGTTVLEVDENGQQTEKRFAYHGNMEDGWLMTILSPESLGTRISRDGLGQVYRVFQGEVQQDDQLFGYARFYTRDARGFLMQETHEETGTTVYGRDNVGNMTSKEIGSSGVVETRTYDDLNRVQTISYSDGTPTATYSYDANSNLTSVSNSAATRTYNYDQNGNLTGESLAIGGATYDVLYGIDNLDYLTSVTYPSGRVINYGTNVFGWQTQAGPYVNSVTHYPNGSLDTMTYANGVITDQNLDNRLRPDSLVTDNGQLNIVDLQFGYDLAGNLDSIVDNAGSLHDRTIGYDGVNRMTSATGPWGTETISYDGRGNILSRDRNGDLQEYYYNSDKMTYRLFTNFYYAISHDARGNMTSDGPNVMTYDGANNLTSVDTGSDVIDYTYDGANTRVSRASSTELTNVFYSIKGDLLGEYDSSAGFKEYIYVDSKVAAKVVDDTAVVGQ
ncbi:RHS repeat domain-containing protein [Marinobacter oulmenensis]|uniref:YD repeat-containing protein n=1 Tax=Marinobacter oulmenensis TaxID=643747 RepID=A0A840UKA6_9GAMM|nr:RHS repeat protein [Marinobacter oulmenensis]MBB5321168.1 YD repeat-containing protein [Marinobacter oulmenensis]